MIIKFNGKSEEITSANLSELMKLKNINLGRVVIEHNLNIIDKEKLAQVILKENDVIEVLSFIGGG